MNAPSWLLTLLFRTARIAVLTYVGLLALLAACQRRYIYHPARLSMDAARQAGRHAGLEPWHDADGQFAGWRRPMTGIDPQSRQRVLVFHGNAGHALHRTYYLDGFEAAAPGAWDVVLFEYPGFGPRVGRPTETSITAAAASALAGLSAEASTPVYVVGESLGSGPACRLAAEHAGDVAGLWLVTPFSSLADAAKVHYPVFPVRLLLRDRYDNRSALQSYQGPVAVLTAGRDGVIPARLGRRLYDGAATARKHWMQQADADHNTLDLSLTSKVWSDVITFWTPAREEHDDIPDGTTD